MGKSDKSPIKNRSIFISVSKISRIERWIFLANNLERLCPASAKMYVKGRTPNKVVQPKVL